MDDKIKNNNPIYAQGIKPQYNWSKKEPIMSLELYNKFINWINTTESNK
ncbi:hypothetical protein [Changchengzhania lutea]|nr:hypothetical protein [Changchengzhania lutea]